MTLNGGILIYLVHVIIHNVRIAQSIQGLLQPHVGGFCYVQDSNLSWGEFLGQASQRGCSPPSITGIKPYSMSAATETSMFPSIWVDCLCPLWTQLLI